MSPEVDGDERPDAELVRLAATGHQAAFGELYRRHVDRARWVARGVTSNAEDTADAVAEAFANVFRVVRSGRFPEDAEFLPYLVTAARRAAIDQVRRASRTVADGDIEDHEWAATTTRPSERVVAVESATLVARAFHGLPSHLRLVLQLVEVEGKSMREAAALLGISPNAVAQRAVRARARLRQRYLQAHLAPWAEERCRQTVSQLGAYVGEGLANRDVQRVEAHLEGCERCRQRVVELRELGAVLRRAVPAFPLDAAGAGRRKR
ncbi:MAG: sigma-70 family RNA polymerase sigma factor [Actinomycetota bacterium]|nr:sigma-70 family RNA polymerase sigma factor [Actinomycetota bacterium]